MRKFIGRIIWYFLEDYRNQAIYIIDKFQKQSASLKAPIKPKKVRKRVKSAQR